VIERIKKALVRGQEDGTVTNFEVGFLTSIKNQFERNAELTLSQKQLNWFQKIEGKVNSYNPVEWQQSWDAEKKRNLKIVIEYYKHSGLYFHDIIQWTIDNPDKIISKQNYQRIAENKYAKKVIKALSDSPAYNEGEYVTVRSSHSIPTKFFKHKGKMFFILRPLDKAVAAAHGARLYLVLSSDSAETFIIEERWLKKYKKVLTK
jgi:hypothetical protein